MARKNWMYWTLLIPMVFGILGFLGYGFLFKSGTAGFGILVAVYLLLRESKTSADLWALIGAFVFSIGGDWFLSTRNGETERFVIGIALFFVAHIGYLTYALLNGKIRRNFTVGFTLVFLIYYALVLYPAIDEVVLNIAVLIYLLISCLSFGIAVGFQGDELAKRAYIFGIFLVLFSDTIISIKEFVGIHEVDWLILPTYYLAHIAVTFSMISTAKSSK